MKIDDIFLIGNTNYFEKFIENVLEEENKFLKSLNAGSEYFILEQTKNKVVFDNKAKSIPYKILKNIVDYKTTIYLQEDNILVNSNPVTSDNIKKVWINMFLESDLPIEDNYFLMNLLEKIHYFTTKSDQLINYKIHLEGINYKDIINKKIEQGLKNR